MLRLRGLDTVRISKVKGHADEALVRAGRARELDRFGNYGADEAAAPACSQPASFFFSIAWGVVNHDGVSGIALDPLVWSEGGAPKRRRVVHAVRDRPFFLGFLGFGMESGALLLRLIFLVMILSYGLILLVCLLKRWLFSLLCAALRMGRILELVVSLMLSCLFLMSYGLVKGQFWKRLFLGAVERVAQFQSRLFFFLVQALIFCDLVGILVRCFVLLLVCLAVFVGSFLVIWVLITAGFGTLGGRSVDMALLPGLVSRARKVFQMSYWFYLVILLALLLHCWVGSLPLRYCSGRFACRVPTWGLPARGHVQGLVAEFAGVGNVPRSSHVDRVQLLGLLGGVWVLGGRRILGGVGRVRLHWKTPAHLAGFGRDGSQSRPRVWKRLGSAIASG